MKIRCQHQYLIQQPPKSEDGWTHRLVKVHTVGQGIIASGHASCAGWGAKTAKGPDQAQVETNRTMAEGKEMEEEGWYSTGSIYCTGWLTATKSQKFADADLEGNRLLQSTPGLPGLLPLAWEAYGRPYVHCLLSHALFDHISIDTCILLQHALYPLQQMQLPSHLS